MWIFYYAAELNTSEYLDDMSEHIARFDCSDEPDVEVYLREKAELHQRQRTTSTRLFFNESGEMVGYYTVLTDLVQIGKGKQKDMNWNLDRIRSMGKFPAIKIHYIGVDRRYRDMGYGKQIMGYAQGLCVELSKTLGFNFITAEVKNKRVEWFKERGFHFGTRDSNTCLTLGRDHYYMCIHILDLESKLKATLGVSA